MKFYFHLQFSRLKRHIKDAGANPIIVLIILPILFILGSNQLFLKIDYAKYIYMFIALATVNTNGNVKRNNFLNNIFKVALYREIRIIENVIFAFPFVLYLIYQQHFAISLSTLIISILLSFFNNNSSLNLVIPTPFYKRPFEFVIGFRNTFWIFIISYGLTVISISVDNFNLGVFGLIITFLTCMGFYSTVEPDFYVWIHSQKVKKFLFSKLKTILLFSFGLSLPIVVSLVMFYPENWWLIIIFEILGLLIIIINMLGKYAYFPSEINIIQALAIIFSVLFPPLIFIVLPYFFTKSINNLSRILK